jgi:hypothetical protein
MIFLRFGKDPDGRNFSPDGESVFEAKERLVNRTGEMIFTHGTGQGRPTSVGHASQDYVAAQTAARAARSFFGEVFCWSHRI